MRKFKKYALKTLALSLVMVSVLGMTSCGKKDDSKKFVAGFDASFPPYGYQDEKEIMLDLTWIWHRKFVKEEIGNWLNSQLIGSQKIWN